MGRALSSNEVAAIDPLLAIRNDVAIAAVLSEGRVRLQSKYIGAGTIIAVMRPHGLSGGAFIDQLVAMGATDRDVYWAMDLIKQGRFDIGEPAAQVQMDVLASLLPDFALGLAALKALGQVPDPVNFNHVSDALNVAEGRMTL